MSQLPTLGYMIGEMSEDHDLKKRGYTDKTNDRLAGDNATPFPTGDVACVGFEPPAQVRTPEPTEGYAFRKAMADQGDKECILALTRR
jgi:hypothetical protein